MRTADQIALDSALAATERAAIQPAGDAVHQFRKAGCSDWYDGYPDHEDGGGPYELRTLFAAPVVQAMPSQPAGDLRAWLRRLEDESPAYSGMQLFTKVRTYLQAEGYLGMQAKPASLGEVGSVQEDAERWKYIKATTTAIRNSETGEREECTPEQFEQSVDRLRALQGKPEAQAGEKGGQHE
jgi:hypothetical protein